MERQRQITQDMKAVSGDFAFLPNDTVAILEERTFREYTQVPSRVEGVPRNVEVARSYLAKKAIYPNLATLIAEKNRPLPLETDQGWRMEHIPRDAFEQCDEWAQVLDVPTLTELDEASAEIAANVAHNWQDETTTCLHCPEDVKYACYTSGRTRQLYRYPLIEVVGDDATYEVPFNVALFAQEVEGGVGYKTNYVIDQSKGRLMASRSAGVLKDYVTREYVAKATDGRLEPNDEVLYFKQPRLSPANEQIIMDGWSEKELGWNPYSRSKKVLSAVQLLTTLQDQVMMANLERADGVDYNEKLATVRQKLAKCGLGIMFGTRYEGMGDVSMFGALYDPQKQQRGREYSSAGYAESLLKMYDELIVKRD